MLWLKALHIMAVISWLAGLFYLPRLFVYHSEAAPGSEAAQTFQVMEERLMRIIMTPAMAVVWITGPLLAWWQDVLFDGWFLAKMALVLALSAFHGACGGWRKELATGTNQRPAKFYRTANEVPTLLMVGIVILVVVKPF